MYWLFARLRSLHLGMAARESGSTFIPPGGCAGGTTARICHFDTSSVGAPWEREERGKEREEEDEEETRGVLGSSRSSTSLIDCFRKPRVA